MKIADSVIVITGGANGLGKELMKIFVEKGAQVVICDKDNNHLDQIAKEFPVKTFVADVTNEPQVAEVAKNTVELFGRIDLWVNDAGVWMPRNALEDVDMERAQKLFQTNVFGTIHGMRSALRQMKQQGSGTVMNIVSTTAFDGMTGSSGSMYITSKYALRGLTNAIREELKDTNIKILGVYPGGFKSHLFGNEEPENINEFMTTESVAEKIVRNLELAEPEEQLIIKRPGQKLSHELTTTQEKNI